MFAGSIVKPGFNPLATQTPTYTYFPYLYSWGYSRLGELGLGNTLKYSSPKQVGSLTTWLTIASGNYNTISIKTDGTLWSWGFNNTGQLGLGNTTRYSSPVQVGALTNWLNVSCGNYHVLATRTDGTLWTWGRNSSGQLGLGNTTYYSSPKQVGALTNWNKITCSTASSFAIKTDGTLWSWGGNGLGILGIGNTTNYSSPKQIGSLTTWAYIASKFGPSPFVLAVKTDKTLWAWGGNGNGTLGLGNLSNTYSSPTQVGALNNWAKPFVGNSSSFVTKTDGTLWVWGSGGSGRLGLGNTTRYSSPVQLGALTTWLAVAGGGYNFTLATKTNGTLWSWGSSNNGQLGLGNITSYSSPKQIGLLTNWLSISAGYYSSIATLY